MGMVQPPRFSSLATTRRPCAQLEPTPEISAYEHQDQDARPRAIAYPAAHRAPLLSKRRDIYRIPDVIMVIC
jgi:hypothetical protein